MTRLVAPAMLLLPLLAMAGGPSAKNPAPIQAAAAKNPKAPLQAIEPPPVPLGWTIGAGVMWRQIGELDFRGGHRAGMKDIPKLKSSTHSGGGGGYSDGYVLPDSTGGLQTWNWGYTSVAQVSGDNLNFTSSSSRISQSAYGQSFSNDWSDDLEGTGVFIQVESPEFYRWKRLSFSAAGSYSFVQDESHHEAEAFQAVRQTTEYRTSRTDSYDISAIAPLPAAPYGGTFNGPGPVISTTPASSSGGGTSRRMLEDDVYTSRVEQSVEVRLHTLSAGPRVGFDLGQVRAVASMGMALNIADWEGSSQETLRHEGSGKVIRRWNESAGETELLAGVYAELGLQWQFLPRWTLNAGARYDWSQELSGELAASEFDVDLGGWSAMLGIGWEF